jgi:hypothetical protein
MALTDFVETEINLKTSATIEREIPTFSHINKYKVLFLHRDLNVLLQT